MAFLQRGRTYGAAGRPRTNRARRRRGSGVGVLGNASRCGDVAYDDFGAHKFQRFTPSAVEGYRTPRRFATSLGRRESSARYLP